MYLTQSLMLFFALGVFLFQGANAQDANVPACSCSPLIYKWTLDFNRTCAPAGLSLGIGSDTGVASIECDITMVNTSDPIDLVPVTLKSYEIIELSTDRLAPIKINSEADLDFQDGQHLALTSETAANPSLVSRGVKATIGALNLAGHGIELSWIIRYTNVCGAKPFEVGDSIGWTVLNKDTVPARDQTCIIPSNPPSSLPSESPTRTVSPTHLQTKTLSSVPSANPTIYSNYGKGGKGNGYTPKDSKSQKTTKNSKASHNTIPKAAKSQKTLKKNSDGSDYTSKSAKSQKAPKDIKRASVNARIHSKPTSSEKEGTITTNKANFEESQKYPIAIDEEMHNDKMTSKPSPSPKKYTATGKKGSKAKSTKSKKAPKTAKDTSYGKKRRTSESN